MVDEDTDPFGKHDKTATQLDEPMGKTIPLTPGGVGGSIWQPECETSFGVTFLRMEVLKDHVKRLYHVLTKYLG